MKESNEELKSKLIEHEKLVDILSYFFKKIESYYQSEILRDKGN